VATAQNQSQAPSRRHRSHGESGFLSRASDWDLPVGSRIDPSGVDGYYIDFRSKVTEPQWPPDWLPPLESQLHVNTAQWGLGCFERYLTSGDERALGAATDAARHLSSLMEADGGIPHTYSMRHTFQLPRGWRSAMAQGETASLLVRVSNATGAEELADAASKALQPMRRRTEEGGTMALLGGTPFPEEYPTRPPSFVLNGGIFALWGYRDVGLGLDASSARSWFEEGVSTLMDNLHRWDTGYWSLYDLRSKPIPNVASAAYHTLHIDQLDAMQLVQPDPTLAATVERWRRYRASRPKGMRAFAAKAAFRLLVPRNRYLARRLPTARRFDTVD
jgi:hypothetical protein